MMKEYDIETSCIDDNYVWPTKSTKEKPFLSLMSIGINKIGYLESDALCYQLDDYPHWFSLEILEASKPQIQEAKYGEKLKM